MRTSFTGVSTGIARELALLGAIAALSSPSVANAQQTAQLTMDLPEQRLGDSLRALAALSGQVVLADGGSVAAKRAPALRGSYSLKQALDRLLAGSGLVAYAVQGGYAVRRADAGGDAPNANGDAITVTGSRIRGALISSQVIRLDADALRDGGRADLGEVVRDLPQSFGGGQNPGIGISVPQSAGANAGGGSTVNLRGLGSDATLTLVNGRRLPYDSALQGVDISAIPMAAVERLEIVADGASAIYGSDAVGGVVNVILREDYDGLEAQARLGGATQGGDFQQRYGLLGGHRWQSGGFFATYEYNRNTDVVSNQRDSTSFQPNLTLLPASHRHALAGHFHQDLARDLTLEVDGLYNRRKGSFFYPLNAQADLDVSRTERSYNSYSFAVSGALHYTLHDWRLSASMTLGRGRNDMLAEYYYDDVLSLSDGLRYANRSTGGELSATGDLVSLPAGAVGLAAGAGFRSNGFEIFRGAGNYQNVRPTQDSQYVYGELSLPLVSNDMGIHFVRALTASAALRHEHYEGIGGVTTPKLGAIYTPLEGIALKASWGRSFRAPSFYDLYGVQAANLYPISRFGGEGYAPDATALLVSGGNADLKPERAESWSAGVDIRPQALPGFGLELSYFATHYTNRVVTPITLTAQALTNSAYASQLTYSPDASLLEDVLAGADTFVNATSNPYDPANVAVLIDNRNVNAGRQDVKGLDVQATYEGEFAAGRLTAALNASYLESSQQIAEGQSVETLAGHLYNPPHWRGQARAGWEKAGLRLSAAVNYQGGVRDTRSEPMAKVRGMTTFDIGARYAFSEPDGALNGTQLGLTITNLFDAMPGKISTTLFYDTPYDSTNYSPVGRFVAFEVRRTW
ncbi:TonB-dependent receptor [Novosphingobium profundi]|uniref:TonB-dependent receptor n=1 Tax=Novosphingobium profundi TaxID=1774954 RepID=UPI001BD938A5|nr:TonB-dependent receptor [Novosphingobium profundi]MBT0670621.1 TonB-dependent receptor [Novosphingobium profundi]